MGAAKLSSDQRLSLIIETQREILASDGGLHSSMQLIAERSQEIIGADGAMINLLESEMLHTVGVSGHAVGVIDSRRPVSGSIARFAIADGQPILIQDCANDERIDQTMQSPRVGDHSLICVPLFSGSDVIGTVNVMRLSPDDPFGEDDRETLEMISVLLSSVVSRAAEIEARQAQAVAINRFRTLFDEASFGILRLNKEGHRARRQPGACIDARGRARRDHRRRVL